MDGKREKSYKSCFSESVETSFLPDELCRRLFQWAVMVSDTGKRKLPVVLLFFVGFFGITKEYAINRNKG
jgi:hypothetical protein